MRIFFGTVHRNAPVEKGGELVRLDWERKAVETRFPIAPTNPDLADDPNPRGNTRGCRGIQILGDDVIAASYASLQIFDRDLNMRRELSHGLMVGLHETWSAGDGRIWVSSTAIDGALEYDLESGAALSAFWPREMPAFQTQLGLEPIGIDTKEDQRARFLGDEHRKHPSHLHLNAVTPWRGEVYALFHAQGVVANLTSGEIVICEPDLKGGHNLVFTEEGRLLVNDTYGHALRVYDVDGWKLIRSLDLCEYPWVRSIRRVAVATNFVKKVARELRLVRSSLSRPLFTRGLAVDGDLAYIGISPASIVCVDWQRGEFVDAYCYSKDVNLCMFGIALDPR